MRLKPANLVGTKTQENITMSLTTDILDVLNGKIPEGSMMVKTSHHSNNVEFYGANGKGFKIPLKEVDNFINELKGLDPDVNSIIEIDKHEVIVPGNRIPMAIRYLKFAKTTGVELKSFSKLF